MINKTHPMKRFLLITLSAIFIAAAYSGCKKCDCQTVTKKPVTTEEVMLINTSFSPAEKTITRGTTVRWTNHDPYAHTVTSNTNIFNSGNLDPGQTFDYTFNAAGTFDYHCNYHSSIMKGKIIVN
jgi:plastocyanin